MVQRGAYGIDLLVDLLSHSIIFLVGEEDVPVFDLALAKATALVLMLILDLLKLLLVVAVEVVSIDGIVQKW